MRRTIYRRVNERNSLAIMAEKLTDAMLEEARYEPWRVHCGSVVIAACLMVPTAGGVWCGISCAHVPGYDAARATVVDLRGNGKLYWRLQRPSMRGG